MKEGIVMKHGQKMIAPVVVTVIFVAYLFGLIAIWATGDLPLPDLISLSIIPFGLSCVMVHVCIQRIREIKGGEEDDLSKY